jgi:hypothetical protein
MAALRSTVLLLEFAMIRNLSDMMGNSSFQNDTDPVHKESDQVNSGGVSFSESTVATSEYMSIGSNKDTHTHI